MSRMKNCKFVTEHFHLSIHLGLKLTDTYFLFISASIIDSSSGFSFELSSLRMLLLLLSCEFRRRTSETVEAVEHEVNPSVEWLGVEADDKLDSSEMSSKQTSINP